LRNNLPDGRCRWNTAYVPGVFLFARRSGENSQIGPSQMRNIARRTTEAGMKVRDAMHKGVDWVKPDVPIKEVAKRMKKEDIGAIPVGERDRLIGMITDRDIVCKGLAHEGFNADRTTAGDVMTRGIHCCREDDDLEAAVKHMELLQVRRLPVINKNKRMVGMLSLGDVGQAAQDELVSECIRSVSAHHEGLP
jgi:CBS domain-containing protein